MKKLYAMARNNENDFAGGGVGKLADDDYIKKIVKVKTLDKKIKKQVNNISKFSLKSLLPILYLGIVFVVTFEFIQHVTGIDRFLEFAKNLVRLILT